MLRHGRLSVPTVVAAVCVLYAIPAPAAVFQPRLSAGLQDYEISFSDVTSTNANGGLFFRDGFTLSDRVSFFGAGLTLSSGRLFADLSGQRSETGHDQTQQYQGVATGFGFTSGSGHNHDLLASFERDEINATIGWGFTPQFSAYLGYKHAKVDLQNGLTPILSPPPSFGDVLFFGSRVIDFTYDGVFVGATYSLPVDSWGGAFSIQSSVAFLDGTFEERFDGNVFIVDPIQLLVQIDPSFVNGKIEGDSRGLNLGVSWTGGFGWLSKRMERFTYTIGIDRSEYEFDTTQSSTGNFQEQNTRVRLDLRYRFQSGGT